MRPSKDAGHNHLSTKCRDPLDHVHGKMSNRDAAVAVEAYLVQESLTWPGTGSPSNRATTMVSQAKPATTLSAAAIKTEATCHLSRNQQ